MSALHCQWKRSSYHRCPLYCSEPECCVGTALDREEEDSEGGEEGRRGGIVWPAARHCLLCDLTLTGPTLPLRQTTPLQLTALLQLLHINSYHICHVSHLISWTFFKTAISNQKEPLTVYLLFTSPLSSLLHIVEKAGGTWLGYIRNLNQVRYQNYANNIYKNVIKYHYVIEYF